MSEQWDVFDINRNTTGKTVFRGSDLNKNEYHLIVHVWIETIKNKYIISKRSLEKDYAPGLWEVPGGCVQANETSIDAAIREVKEEIGIDLLRSNGKCILRNIGIDSKRHIFIDVWKFNQDVGIEQIRIQKEEVEQTRIVSDNEIMELVNRNMFMPDCSVYLDFILEKKET
jgi:8-oxo-dGTP diphosphatase